ncbi:MAG: winged helix-turn-helix domain-containing protein, partial [Hyphomicrobiales bacterium]|nr:winged helix-turn-helix domain-containing protein [Hyphomicrobiales bacterium]
CKPFSPRELVARVKAIFRRMDLSSTTADGSTTTGRLRLDMEKWAATVDGRPLDLTRRELQLLSVLHNRPGRVFSRAQLIDLAFPDDADVFDRIVDSHIKNVRRKIKAIDPEWDPIRSVYGVGYAFDDT